jgi:hypothetical protein
MKFQVFVALNNTSPLLFQHYAWVEKITRFKYLNENLSIIFLIFLNMTRGNIIQSYYGYIFTTIFINFQFQRLVRQWQVRHYCNNETTVFGLRLPIKLYSDCPF